MGEQAIANLQETWNGNVLSVLNLVREAPPHAQAALVQI